MTTPWLTTENVKWVITTLAIPVSLALSTVLYNVWAAKRSESESRLKLYTELVNKREEADTNLRKEIFSKLMERYLEPGGADLESRLAVLELLSQNFNESLNLGPLFWQLDRQIANSKSALMKEWRTQLERIASEVKQRQLDLLRVYGRSVEGTPVLTLTQPMPILDAVVTADLPLSDARRRRIGCHFIVEALERDPAQQRVLVRVQSFPLESKEMAEQAAESGPGCGSGSGSNGAEARQWAFYVDPYDFPLVNYTRVSSSERFAVVLEPDQSGVLRFNFVYFPSSLGGVRDKPFIDEVMSKLRSGN
jgi:hypothetical protein